MKRFKQIDILVSAGLITGFTITCIFDPGTIFTAYFITGGWQVLSMLVHAFAGWFTEKNSYRVQYHWISGLVITMGILTSIIPVFGIIYLIMLFGAPVMAIIYTLISYNEMKSLSKRPSDIF